MIHIGTYYFLVSPKLKAMFCFGKSFNEDTLDTVKNKLDIQQNLLSEEDTVETFEWTIGNLKDRKLKDMLKVVSFYDDLAWLVSDWQFWNYTFTISFKRFDKDAYIISEYDERYDKLKKEGYAELDTH